MQLILEEDYPIRYPLLKRKGISKMLILSRKIGESLIINDSIEVKVIDVNGDKIKLGIKAPADVKVLRSELCQTAEANRIQQIPRIISNL